MVVFAALIFLPTLNPVTTIYSHRLILSAQYKLAAATPLARVAMQFNIMHR
jgi:hypothetical protein